MNIRLDMKDQKQPKRELSPEIEFYNSLPEDDELKNIDILNYFSNKEWQSKEYQEFMENHVRVFDFEKYLITEDGKNTVTVPSLVMDTESAMASAVIRR